MCPRPRPRLLTSNMPTNFELYSLPTMDQKTNYARARFRTYDLHSWAKNVGRTFEWLCGCTSSVSIHGAGGEKVLCTSKKLLKNKGAEANGEEHLNLSDPKHRACHGRTERSVQRTKTSVVALPPFYHFRMKRRQPLQRLELLIFVCESECVPWTRVCVCL